MSKKLSKHIHHLTFFVLALIIIFPLLNNASTASSNTAVSYDLIVSNNGNISSIQEAIDLSSISDVILVKNGTYNENLVIDKSIHLIGENKTLTVIDGRNTGNVIKINTQNVTIEQLTIRNSGKIFPNAGINLTGSNTNIKNNIIKNNFYGMTIYKAHNNTIQNNDIKNDRNCGVYISRSTSNSFLNNTVTNHTYNGFGVYDSSNNNIFKNNTITNNRYCGINLRISSNNIITSNTIINNNIGIHIPVEDNRIENNTFSNNAKKFDKENEFLTPGFEFVITIIVFIIIAYRKKILKVK